MLSKCANPVCSVPFRSLHEGKLFLVENRPGGPETSCGGRRPPLRREHYWLCKDCAGHFTLRFDAQMGMLAVPLSPEMGYQQSGCLTT